MTLLTTINKKSTFSYFQPWGWIWTNLITSVEISSPGFNSTCISGSVKSHRLYQGSGQLHSLLNFVRTVCILLGWLIKYSHGQLFYLISSPIDVMTSQLDYIFPEGTFRSADHSLNPESSSSRFGSPACLLYSLWYLANAVIPGFCPWPSSLSHSADSP